jgi:hypothetical protein
MTRMKTKHGSGSSSGTRHGGGNGGGGKNRGGKAEGERKSQTCHDDVCAYCGKKRLLRQQVLGPGLGHVERVEVVAALVARVHGLDVELPLRVVAGGDGVVEVLGGVAVVGASDGDGLVVEQGPDAAGGAPVELDVARLAGAVDERVGVDAGAVHVAVVGGDADVVEEEGEHVQALRVVREEVGDAPVLLDVRPGVGLERVHHVRAVADEEDGEVVAHQVPVALPGVELDGEPARVAQRLRAAALVEKRTMTRPARGGSRRR